MEPTRYFYPRSPCGERRESQPPCERPTTISIHALLAESDVVSTVKLSSAVLFLSTLSLRRATSSIDDLEPSKMHFYPRSPCGERRYIGSNIPNFTSISIHALLAESDIIRQHSKPDGGNFYPRSPCGERQAKLNRTAGRITFLSTLSLRRATRL